jgi:methylmalonyl-CoA mutase N-terminal domain/subunit
LTAQQVDNNITRTTLESLAAVLGGAQSIHTNGKDEAISLPTEENATTALRIQQIIAYESGITNFVDPVGDSKVVKDLTNNIVDKVNSKIDEIFNKGGMKLLIENGEIQQEIEDSAFQFQKNIDSVKTVLVGVNKYTSNDSVTDNGISFNDCSDKRISRLKNFKKKRDKIKANQSLDELTAAANTNKNLIPKIINCAEKNCTLGEIVFALKKVFGEYS